MKSGWQHWCRNSWPTTSRHLFHAKRMEFSSSWPETHNSIRMTGRSIFDPFEENQQEMMLVKMKIRTFESQVSECPTGTWNTLVCPFVWPHDQNSGLNWIPKSRSLITSWWRNSYPSSCRPIAVSNPSACIVVSKSGCKCVPKYNSVRALWVGWVGRGKINLFYRLVVLTVSWYTKRQDDEMRGNQFHGRWLEEEEKRAHHNMQCIWWFAIKEWEKRVTVIQSKAACVIRVCIQKEPLYMSSGNRIRIRLSDFVTRSDRIFVNMGYDLDRFDHVSPQLICPVCKDVFEDPQELECQHHLCLTCLNGCLTDGCLPIRCPVCRKISSAFEPPKLFFRDTYKDHMIKCKWHKYGCDVLKVIGEEKKHEAECKLSGRLPRVCVQNCGYTGPLVDEDDNEHSCVHYLKSQIQILNMEAEEQKQNFEKEIQRQKLALLQSEVTRKLEHSDSLFFLQQRDNQIRVLNEQVEYWRQFAFGRQRESGSGDLWTRDFHSS